MEDTQVLTPPSVEGPGTKTPAQATETPPQGTSQPQKTEPVKVDDAGKVPQVPEARRPRSSDFYEHRDRTRRLEEAFKSQTQKMEEMAALIRELREPKKPDATETKNWTEADWKKFLENPESILYAREQKLLEKIQKMEESLTQLTTSQIQSEKSMKEREALELLFPKTSPNSNETLKERIDNNPDRVEKVMQLLKSTGLDDFSRVNPEQAAKLVSKLLEEESKNPTVLKKELMGGNARGNPSMGSQKTPPIEEKRVELKRLVAEMDNNPELRFDKNHKEKREAVMRDIERLAK